MSEGGLINVLKLLEQLPIQLTSADPIFTTNIKGRPQAITPKITTSPVSDNELFCCAGKIVVEASESTQGSSEETPFTVLTTSTYRGSRRVGVFDFSLETTCSPPDLPVGAIPALMNHTNLKVEEIRLGILFFKTYPAYRFWGENPALVGHLLLEATRSHGYLEVRGQSDKKTPSLPELPNEITSLLVREFQAKLGISITP
jgi:hypothetical protein